jgi:hypothetical protein
MRAPSTIYDRSEIIRNNPAFRSTLYITGSRYPDDLAFVVDRRRGAVRISGIGRQLLNLSRRRSINNRQKLERLRTYASRIVNWCFRPSGDLIMLVRPGSEPLLPPRVGARLSYRIATQSRYRHDR